MSKIGKIPVAIDTSISAVVANGMIEVKGTKGSLTFPIPQAIIVSVEEGRIVVTQEEKRKEKTKALFGLTRAMIANMVTGVSKGFEKKLEMTGVGYRAQVMGKDLSLSVGYSHPVKIAAPEGITFVVADGVITVSGIDKAVVGNVAATIRAVRPPEPYKGKGIKYVGERIRRKAGKSAKAVGGK